MPELAELERFRLLAHEALGRTISDVALVDSRYLRQGLDAACLGVVLRDRNFSAVRRFGKMILFSVGEHELGLHFGMTGILLVDRRSPLGVEGLDRTATKPSWDRIVVCFSDGGDLRVRDRRRLGIVTLDPDLASLGPDALSVTRAELAQALSGGREPVKARLLDQTRVAGLGNLSVDEALWRAGVDPSRPSGSLTPDEVDRLHHGIVSTIHAGVERGASHGGPLDTQRHDGGRCTTDGHPLAYHRIRGRGTWFCPLHQK